MIRRHTKGDKEIHFEPALTVVSGNYVTAKRRGVVDGTDFGLTGEVGPWDRDEKRALLTRRFRSCTSSYYLGSVFPELCIPRHNFPKGALRDEGLHSEAA